jgi:hypothetical protein
MFDMFSKNDEAPRPPMPEVTDNTPIMTESTPIGGGAENQTDIPQVPDMNPAPNISSVPTPPDMSQVPSIDTFVPTRDTSVAEPAENTNSDTFSMPAQEQTAPSIGEMPTREANTFVTEQNVHNPIMERENSETNPSVETAMSLVSDELKSIDSILKGYEDLQNELEELKQTVDNNNNEKPNLLNRRARLQEIKEGIESGDPKVIAMAETFLSLPKSTQTSNGESTPAQNSDTQAA